MSSRPDLIATAQALGIEIHQKGREFVATVPWRTDIRPSLALNTDKQRWFDNGRAESGDGFALIMRVLNYSFAEARRWAESRSLVGPGTTGIVNHSVKPSPSKIWFSTCNWEDARRRWANFWPVALNWINAKLPLPDLMNPEGAMNQLEGICGGGLWYDSELKRERPAILMPFLDVKGNLTGGVKARFIEVDSAWPNYPGGKPAEKSKSYGSTHSLNAPALCDGGDSIFVLAGERDLMTAILRGWRAVAVAGEGTRKLDLEEVRALRQFKRVILLYDADKAGREGANLTAAQWRNKHGINALVADPNPTWPGKDLTEWIASEL